MLRQVKASVLVRSFNNETTVAAALSSALAQKFPRDDYEIIAVDDGSTDSTPELLRSFGANVAVHLEPHRGNVDTAHAALSKAGGKYFSFLDADDTYEADFLPEMDRALEANPSAAFAYCDYYEVNADGARKVTIDGAIIRLLACNCLFDRGIVLREGFWRKDLMLPELGLAIELAQRYPVVHVPKPLYHYYRHSASMTLQSGFFAQAIAQLQDRYRPLLAGRQFAELRIDECRAAAEQMR
jgi:glycosyltransferase involved in cell wall biosynthesis